MIAFLPYPYQINFNKSQSQMKRSFVSSSPGNNSNRKPPPQIHLEQFPLYKNNFSQITIQTNDIDVPFIALFKPNLNKSKNKSQAASKIALFTSSMEKLRTFFAFSKIMALEPIDKLFNTKTLFLGKLLEKTVLKREQKGLKSLTVNSIKKKGVQLGAKIINKIQNSLFQRNIRGSFDNLVKNKLLCLVQELSNENQQAQELDSARKQIYKQKQQNFSEEFINISKSIPKTSNFENLIQLMDENKYGDVLKQEIKRFEQLRNSSVPRRKDHLDNQLVITILSNLIAASKKQTQGYENAIAQLQNQLQGYKNTEGINQLKQVIRQKDSQLREIDNFIGEITRMDTQLKKFTPENRFQVDRVGSTINNQLKKLQTKIKSLEGASAKISTSKIYSDSVISTLVKKLDDIQEEHRQALAAKIQEGREQANELRQCKKELQTTKNELKQDRVKISSLLQKKEVKRGLEELKRRWKGNEQLKSLLDYLLNLHIKIEELQKSERVHVTHDHEVKEIIVKITNFMNSSLEQLKQTNKLSQSKVSIHIKDSTLKQLMTSVQRAYSYLFESHREHQELLQSDIKLSYQSSLESEPESARRKSEKKEPKTTPSPHLQRKSIDKKIQRTPRQRQRQRQVEQKSVPWKRIVESSGKQSSQSALNESIINQLQQTLMDFKQQLQNIPLHESQEFDSISSQYEAILSALKRIEQKLRALKQSETTINQLTTKNKELLLKSEEQKKQYQQQIQNLQGQLTQNNNLIKKHISQKIETPQRPVPNQNQNDSFKVLIQKFSTLERKFTHTKSASSVESITNANNRNEELMLLLKQSESNVTELTNLNHELVFNLEQKKVEFQDQLQALKQELQLKQNIIKTQIPAANGSDPRVQQFISKNFQLQEEIMKHKSENFLLQQEISKLKLQHQINSHPKQLNPQRQAQQKEENMMMADKMNEMKVAVTWKTAQIQRMEQLLKQAEGTIADQRNKAVELHSQIHYLNMELQKSHLQGEKIAAQTQKQVKKITMVLRQLQMQFDQKNQQFQILNNDFKQQQNVIVKLQRQNASLQQQLRQALLQCNQLQDKNSSLYGQLAHIKAEFYSMQVELQSDKSSKMQNSDQLLHLQSQIKGKQETITNILEKSKVTESTLNQQLFQVKEELLAQQRRYEEQISVKNTLINRHQHKIIELEGTIRMLEQKCSILEQKSNKIQTQNHRGDFDTPQSRDRQIQLLHQQIASLQSFLADISHEYKQLQTKYHQEKQRFGRYYDYAKQQNSMEQIDKAINSLGNSQQLSQQVKSLIINNQQLQISIEELQEERKKLLEKARSMPERQYVVELLFNLLLGARKVSAQSQAGNSIWNQLVQINSQCHDVGELFTQLQKFGLRLISLSG